jgi:hypothetical protein
LCAARRALLTREEGKRGEEGKGWGRRGEEGAGACGRRRGREREEYARLMRRANLVRYGKHEGTGWKGGKKRERRGERETTEERKRGDEWEREMGGGGGK